MCALKQLRRRSKRTLSSSSGFSMLNCQANLCQCESSLKNETSKFQAVHHSFCKLKSFTSAGFERRKEKIMLSEHEKQNAAKIAKLDESMKKTKKDDKTFSILRDSGFISGKRLRRRLPAQ
ncbi:unnamed protein product [Fraxinus pennsylvanica]|uniref:Uncharacterized protein n=1 Tax=Fraxinus pennsylvanica TaxID=56036 RepID=A0AAD1YTR0_9LAMI|nr:unnamed protein product [Fraxinus pennsylvanica]